MSYFDNYKHSFYQENIILSIYIGSIFIVGMITDTMPDIPLYCLVIISFYPHFVEIMMSFFRKHTSFNELWLGVCINATAFPFIVNGLSFELTISGIFLLLISYQSLVHLGLSGWGVSLLIIAIVGILVLYHEPVILIERAPFQLLIIALTSALVFMFNSAGNAYKNVSSIKRNREELKELYSKNSAWVKTISKYLSPKIVNQILSDESQEIKGYTRKPLAIVFSDIVGFTSMSEKTEPNELAFYLNDYLSTMSDIALKYGGTVDKFMGDGIMIFFGDPHSNGRFSDVCSAINMSIEMQNQMNTLNQKWESLGLNKSLQIRIGIHYGEATVGNFGSVSQINYTAIGDSVNRASRLEQLASPTEIAVSHEIKDIAKTRYVFIDKGKFELKGIDAPVSIYNVSYSSADKILI
ncbi:adenylate/guanylate cyclase domain-containing protein [Pseudoalteromonas sp. OFAV1]|uniref:adenylate/guanylate cyclase domain-containing protein n=1 Tax=Pseudoalteromonas sp. OFAV1 TaxID=2908892 RepID=UPI001F186A70|nr:adenylate/guanylate cyclase domain-containing protein [Pseudoalteromonas sp. OFAV1]MCF2900944.1 adenylate/guanylate cyclase domain-containing protein [Pseudoalteromonas sp. OFAV1]